MNIVNGIKAALSIQGGFLVRFFADWEYEQNVKIKKPIDKGKYLRYNK